MLYWEAFSPRNFTHFDLKFRFVWRSVGGTTERFKGGQVHTGIFVHGQEEYAVVSINIRITFSPKN